MGLVQPLGEPVDLFGDRVQVEAGSVRRRDAQLGHQRLAAVVPGADGDAVHVQDLRDVVRVNALEVEGDDPGAPKPTASAIGCVPASNLNGIWPQVVSSSFTDLIM